MNDKQAASNAPAKPKQSLQASLQPVVRQLRRYAGVLFFLLCAGAYSVVILKINTLSSVQVDPSEVSAQVKSAASPHVDPKVIGQLQALKDNSVNVKALFDTSRTNPFQE